MTHNRLFHFVAELRRRRVCRAVTMYSVALWLVCQIVDVITPALELPEWTLKLAIVLGLLGLPVIILMGKRRDSGEIIGTRTQVFRRPAHRLRLDFCCAGDRCSTRPCRIRPEDRSGGAGITKNRGRTVSRCDRY
jgi:hypothetical protein